MARIYKRSDRITVKIDEITLKLAPMTFDQKNEVKQCIANGIKNSDIKQVASGIAKAVKYCVKGVDGIKDSDGAAYVLTFEGDALTDQCVEDLMSIEAHEKLAQVCASLSKGIPSYFADKNGNKIEGVEVVSPEKPDEKKT